MTRRLSGIVAVDTMQFYMGLVGTFLLLPFAIWAVDAAGSQSWGMLVLISLGVLGWAGHQLLTNAHRFGTANQLMPFTYSFLLYSWRSGVTCCLGPYPDLGTILGARGHYVRWAHYLEKGANNEASCLCRGSYD